MIKYIACLFLLILCNFFHLITLRPAVFALPLVFLSFAKTL